jgi:hypothetical protein
MQIPRTANLMEVVCKGKNKKGRECGRYLGRFQVDGQNRYGDYTCPNCGTVTQLYLDSYGLLNTDRMLKTIRLKTPAMVGIAE